MNIAYTDIFLTESNTIMNTISSEFDSDKKNAVISRLKSSISFLMKKIGEFINFIKTKILVFFMNKEEKALFEGYKSAIASDKSNGAIKVSIPDFNKYKNECNKAMKTLQDAIASSDRNRLLSAIETARKTVSSNTEQLTTTVETAMDIIETMKFEANQTISQLNIYSKELQGLLRKADSIHANIARAELNSIGAEISARGSASEIHTSMIKKLFNMSRDTFSAIKGVIKIVKSKDEDDKISAMGDVVSTVGGNPALSKFAAKRIDKYVDKNDTTLNPGTKFAMKSASQILKDENGRKALKNVDV